MPKLSNLPEGVAELRQSWHMAGKNKFLPGLVLLVIPLWPKYMTQLLSSGDYKLGLLIHFAGVAPETIVLQMLQGWCTDQQWMVFLHAGIPSTMSFGWLNMFCSNGPLFDHCCMMPVTKTIEWEYVSGILRIWDMETHRKVHGIVLGWAKCDMGERNNNGFRMGYLWLNQMEVLCGNVPDTYEELHQNSSRVIALARIYFIFFHSHFPSPQNRTYRISMMIALATFP